MIVQIASKLFDPVGVLVIETLSGTNDSPVSRRLSKVATLNGGVAVNDGGFSHGDREITFEYRAKNKNQDTIARRLVELHARVLVSTDEGVFDCVPLRFSPDTERRRFTFSVIEKVA
jgi:hypothetical protein